MMKRGVVDVVIVGGGPAGAVAGMLLARAGHAVTIMERQLFPRAKPCGDCLSPGANVVLQRLGVWADVCRAAPATLTGWRLASPGGHSFAAEFEPTALAITRDRLDTVLLDHARAAGATVECVQVVDLVREPGGAIGGVQLRTPDGPRTLAARLVIGADGLRSVVARRLSAHARAPRLRKASFTAHVRLRSSSTLGELHLLHAGCLGIAPVEAGAIDEVRLHNVTLVLQRGSFHNKADARLQLARALRAAGHHICLDDVELLTSGPFDWPVRRTVFDGAALVGDAAGYYDPFTGQGIHQALVGAELLAEHADRALQRTRPTARSLRHFARALRSRQQATKRVQRMIEFVCARPRLADRAFAHLHDNARLARALVAVTGDLMPPAHLLSPRLLKSLAR